METIWIYEGIGGVMYKFMDEDLKGIIKAHKHWYLENKRTKKKLLINNINPGLSRKLRRWTNIYAIYVSNRCCCENCDTDEDAKEYIDAYGNIIHLCEVCMNEVKDLADYKEVKHEPD